MEYNIIMKKLFLIASVFSLVIFSCDLDEKTDAKLPGNFWAWDFKTNKFYRVDADLLYTGTHCTVLAEKGSGISAEIAREIANEYDENIYTIMIDAFSSPVKFNGKDFYNIMDLADWISDGDTKLCILMLDIKDQYKEGIDDSYVAGYFHPVDLMSHPNSNERDMIYIDTNPGFKLSAQKENAYKTLAHEMQHLMNLATSIAKRPTVSGNKIYVAPMDTWIDEGLSSAAEWVYDGHTTNRIDWYKNNGAYKNGVKHMTGLIDKGNNFFVWDNHIDKKYALLDDYATVYLFFQWLRLQSGSTQIYKDIITSDKSCVQAVTNAAKKINTDYSDWDTLLRTWLAANYINASSGIYGYKGDTAFNGIQAHSAPTGGTSISLYPGEGVYSGTNSEVSTPNITGNIKYAALKRSSPYVSDDTFFIGGALLTYNTNPATNGIAETGTTTGVASSVAIAAQSFSGASSAIEPFSGPFPIGAGDISRRFGAEPFIFEFPQDGKSGE